MLLLPQVQCGHRNPEEFGQLLVCCTEPAQFPRLVVVFLFVARWPPCRLGQRLAFSGHFFTSNEKPPRRAVLLCQPIMGSPNSIGGSSGSSGSGCHFCQFVACAACKVKVLQS